MYTSTYKVDSSEYLKPNMFETTPFIIIARQHTLVSFLSKAATIKFSVVLNCAIAPPALDQEPICILHTVVFVFPTPRNGVEI